MYADVSIMSPETKTPIAMVTPVGIAEGVEVDNVSVGLIVCSFTVTVDASMVVVGTLILDVVVILGSVTKEPTKFQQRYPQYYIYTHPAQLWAEMFTDSVVLYMMSKL